MKVMKIGGNFLRTCLPGIHTIGLELILHQICIIFTNWNWTKCE